MNRKSFLGLLSIVLATVAMEARGQTAFTYQGQLKNGGSPASGSYDLQFSLWNASSGGSQLGPTQCSDNVAVANGLLTVSIDFGAQFNGSTRWLQIGVRADSTVGNCGSGSYTTLTSRQALTATPYASFAGAPWATSGSNISYTSGNVGIGTSAVLGKLSIAQSEPDGSGTPTDGIMFESSLVGGFGHGAIYSDGSAGYNGDLVFATDGDSTQNFNPTEKMRIRFNGNVGIGTNNPVAPLSLGDYQGGTVGSAVANFSKQLAVTGAYNTGTNTGNSVKLWIGDYDNDGGASIYPIYCEDENNGVDFYIHNQGGTRSAYFGGNVGIGTTSPNMALDVRPNDIIGNSAVIGGQHDPNNQGTKVSFGYQPSGTTEFAGMRSIVGPGTDLCGNTADIGFYTWECNTSTSREVMRVNGTGNVGIGTTSPTTKLDVRGDVKLGSSGQLYAPGSDERLRMIRGIVLADGSIYSGAGFTITHSGTGKYVIAPNPAFSINSTLTVTPIATGNYIAVVSLADTDGTGTVWIRDTSGNFVNSAFTFIMIAPR